VIRASSHIEIALLLVMARDPRTKIFSGRIISQKVEHGTATFKVESVPFLGDPPHAKDFYEAMGRLIVVWGRFEHQLETCLRVLIDVAKGYGIEQEMYVSFDRKAKIFQDLYRDVPPLSDQHGAAKSLMSDADSVGKQRNHFIHSNVNGWGDADPPFIKLRNYQYRKKVLYGLDIEAELSDINDLAAKADALNTDLASLTNRLIRLAFEKS
jgi:hypothetical protein